MDIQYVYVKTRSEFGRQCCFEDTEWTVEEEILPNHEMMKDYVEINPVHKKIQVSKQFAAYEVQTERTVTKETGMNHTEGGWPKEINPRDEEVVARYRRRIEKDDMWAPRVQELMTPMETCIFENSALNIYEHYFEDMTPTNLVLPLGVRTVNVLGDPQAISQPITHLTWSPDHETRLAASYCSMEFQRIFSDFNLHSYIWDIENPNKAFMALNAVHPSVTIEFNPRDPSMLISGLLSGQVCNWDIRAGNTPISVSHAQFSHRNPVHCALWINSKTNSEFFSASTDGIINWWDIRMLQKPTEILIMDLENPLRADIVKAVGVSALQFEPTMSTKFMAGMENGVVVSGTRKGKNAAEKVALKFDCHHGPVITIDRNPFSSKNFFTIDDWTTKIWAEDTKESNLISTRSHGSILTGGCWSTSRCSVFYVINNMGMMEIFDILVGLKAPVMMTRLSRDSLKAIAPHENGKLVAVGNSKGKIYIAEPSEALTTNFPNDKALMTMYIDRCSRYVKAVDNRFKESRILQRIEYSESVAAIPNRKSKEEPPKGEKQKKKVDDKKKDNKDKKKIQQKKTTTNLWELLGDSSLADVEKKYFETIQQQKDKFAEAALTGSEKFIQVPSTHSGLVSSVKKGKADDSKINKDKMASKKPAPKKRPSKEKVIKGKDAGVSKEIMMIERKSDTQTERIEGKQTDRKPDEQRMKIIGDKMIREEKYPGKMMQDDAMGMLSLEKKKIKVQELMTDSQEEEVDITPKNVEELKMNAVIEKLLAGHPKNILPLSQMKDLPNYIQKQKKLLQKGHYVPSISDKAYKEARKEIFKPTEITALDRLIPLKYLKESPQEDMREPEESAHESEDMEEPRESLHKHEDVTEPESVELPKITENDDIKPQKMINIKNKVNVHRTSLKEKKLENDDCQPSFVKLSPEKIAALIGVKKDSLKFQEPANSSKLAKKKSIGKRK